MNKKMRKRRKSTLGQSEILVAILFIVLVSGAVIAQNATNITNITGGLTDTGGFENITDNGTLQATLTIEGTKTIQVYANSYLSLQTNNSNPYQNETLLLQATLTLDNGSVLSGQEIDFYLDDILMGSDFTDVYGEVLLEVDLSTQTPGTKKIRTEFSGSGFTNPSSEEIQIEILSTEEIANESISYNPETDTITIIGNGADCTETNPCDFSDIYEKDLEEGWGQTKRISDSYYLLDATLVIGDGRNETWFAYEAGEIWINKPWLVRGKSLVRFGSSELPLGCFIDANVAEVDLLGRESAIFVEGGARFEIYNSNFKVFHPTAANNIYFEVGSELESTRFSMQNIHDKEQIPLLYVPQDRVIEKFAAVKNNCIVSSSNQKCTDLVMKEGRYETGGDSNENI